MSLGMQGSHDSSISITSEQWKVTIEINDRLRNEKCFKSPHNIMPIQDMQMSMEPFQLEQYVNVMKEKNPLGMEVEEALPMEPGFAVPEEEHFVKNFVLVPAAITVEETANEFSHQPGMKKVHYASIEEERKNNIQKLTPEQVVERVQECGQCFPKMQFENREQALGHQQNIHGLSYCPVCLILINCHGSMMKEHLEKNHFFNDQGDVHCPICLQKFKYLLCFDHMYKKHLNHLLVKQESKIHPPTYPLNYEISRSHPPGMHCFQPHRYPSVQVFNPIDIKVDPTKAVTPECETILQRQSKKQVKVKSTTAKSVLLNYYLQKRKKTDAAKKKIKISNIYRHSRMPIDTAGALAEFFSTNQYPSGLDMLELAENTGLSRKQIKTWFSNRRQKPAFKMMPGKRGTQDEPQSSHCKQDITPSDSASCQENEDRIQDAENNGENVVSTVKLSDDFQEITKAKNVQSWIDGLGLGEFSPVSYLERNKRISEVTDSNSSAVKIDGERKRARKQTLKVKEQASDENTVVLLSSFSPLKGENRKRSRKRLIQKFSPKKVSNSVGKILYPQHIHKNLPSPIISPEKVLEGETMASQNENTASLKRFGFPGLNCTIKVEEVSAVFPSQVHQKKASVPRLTELQKDELLKFWIRKQYPTSIEYKRLANEIKSTALKVKKWFQRQRQYLKDFLKKTTDIDRCTRKRFLAQCLRYENFDLNECSIYALLEQYTSKNLHFSFDQRTILVNSFTTNMYPDECEFVRLSEQLLKETSVIKTWFIKRRRDMINTGNLLGSTMMKKELSQSCFPMVRSTSTDSTILNSEVIEKEYKKDHSEEKNRPQDANNERNLKLQLIGLKTPVIKLVKLPSSPKLWPTFQKNSSSVSNATKSSEICKTSLTKSTIDLYVKQSDNLKKDVHDTGKCAQNLVAGRAQSRSKTTKVFSDVDKEILQKSFKLRQRPDGHEIDRLAKITRGSKYQIQNWFNYHRYLARHQSEASSTTLSTVVADSHIYKTKVTSDVNGKPFSKKTYGDKSRKPNSGFEAIREKRCSKFPVRVFTDADKEILHKSYKQTRNPDINEIDRLTRITSGSQSQIKTWFKHQRHLSRLLDNTMESPNTMAKLVPDESNKSVVKDLPKTIETKKGGKSIPNLVAGRSRTNIRTKVFTDRDTQILHETFQKAHNPDANEITRLAKITNGSKNQIQNWFNNQRYLAKQLNQSEDSAAKSNLPNEVVESSNPLSKDLSKIVKTEKCARSADLVPEIRESPHSPSKRRKKGAFSENQREILTQALRNSIYPNEQTILNLSREAELTTFQVRQWFGYNRHLFKKRQPMKYAANLQSNVEEQLADKIKSKKTRLRNDNQGKVEQPCTVTETAGSSRYSMRAATKYSKPANLLHSTTDDEYEKPAKVLRRNDQKIEFSSMVTVINEDQNSPWSRSLIRWSSIKGLEKSDFEKNVAEVSLNFKDLMEKFLTCDEDSKELIENESKRLQELMEMSESNLDLGFTKIQQECISDVNLKIVNALLRIKPKDKKWEDLVAKFHVEGIFQTWHNLGIYALLSNTTVYEGLEDFCSIVKGSEDVFVDKPKWFLPAILYTEQYLRKVLL